MRSDTSNWPGGDPGGTVIVGLVPKLPAGEALAAGIVDMADAADDVLDPLDRLVVLDGVGRLAVAPPHAATDTARTSVAAPGSLEERRDGRDMVGLPLRRTFGTPGTPGPARRG